MFTFSVIAKILNERNADTYLLISLISSYLCFGYTIFSVYSSNKMQTVSKAIWLIGLFMIGWPLMLIYVFIVEGKQKENKDLRTT
jgi:RsiW-degrading membrane proteinase PrsW (M82 family)